MCEGSLAVTTTAPASALDWARRYFAADDDEPDPVGDEPAAEPD